MKYIKHVSTDTHTHTLSLSLSSLAPHPNATPYLLVARSAARVLAADGIFAS